MFSMSEIKEKNVRQLGTVLFFFSHSEQFNEAIIILKIFVNSVLSLLEIGLDMFLDFVPNFFSNI